MVKITNQTYGSHGFEIWIYRQLPFQEGQWRWSTDLNRGTFRAPYSRWTQVIKMVGFIRIFQAKKLAFPGFPLGWDIALTSRLPKSDMLTFRVSKVPRFATKHVAPNRPWRWRHLPCDFQVIELMDVGGSAWWSMPLLQWFGDGSIPTIHYYPIFGGMHLHLPPILMLGDFGCSLTMGDDGINFRISPAAAIAICSLWTPTFFRSHFDQGPRSCWLQRPSFCFCIQWQMYMYMYIYLFVYLSISIYTQISTHTHTSQM